jgi:uncharacterized protein (DUF885 family)
MRCYLAVVAIVLVGLSGTFASCRRASPAPATADADATFTTLAGDVLQDYFRRRPSSATDLGIHDYDDRIEDVSQAAREAESATLKAFRRSLAGIDPAPLSLSAQLDREQLIRSLDAEILSLDVIQPWRKDPDAYSSGITRAAYVVMKRPYAPGADRLRSLIAPQKQMPAALAEARKNLANPPRIYTEIAIEQIDGNIGFFKADLPAAFKEVTDPSLRAEFASTNTAVVAALEDYKTFLEKELLPRSNGTFAWGADTYGKALAANEMIELSLDRLLAIAEQDLQKNEAAFQATAREIDASKPPDAVLVSLQRDHPRADKLLETTQNELDELRRFIVERRIVTVPTSEPASVKETPPFMRSTTSASMDTPGPFEKAQLQGFYHMTLPDPRWKPARQADFMRAWYLPGDHDRVGPRGVLRFTSSTADDDRCGAGLARGVSHKASQRAVQSSAGTSQRLPCVPLRAPQELTRQ